ncbi:MAG: DUF3579 domain-containing protein [Candidatus Zeuxoniibacter abyssi]|nr:MAG: DUF3579 domain-containing protein [Candidatus Persebacteraceae bacterium AB1(2)]
MSDYMIIIMGQTTDGGKFRPSDWCERLHGALRSLGEEEANLYSDYVFLINYEGGKSVMVDKNLADLNSQLFEFFINFAKSNSLRISEISGDEWRSRNEKK